MTSWIRVPPKKKTEDTVRPFLFKTSSVEFADEFNQYFYTSLYSQSVKRPLTVYDWQTLLVPLTLLSRKPSLKCLGRVSQIL